ncbi:Fucose permease [Colwellia chukchiensis]|uniref:Fucose permease n=1 Tax=Colwellia chukchiensis TaxID=641665 RepID=A0A1H7I0Z7_9GAMM|nr:MFS transporter [Colwellia chukchiensis]SEK55527.1 Fucose permease [Colwellia chukchiensis]
MLEHSLNQDQALKKRQNDTWAILLSIGVFLTVNNIIYNVLFIILGSAADLKGYSEQQIGFLGTAYLVGQTLANLSSVFWVRKLNWQLMIGVATVVSVLSLYAATFVDYNGFLSLLIITGLACGTAQACVMCCISGLKDPSKAYSLGLGLQVIVAGAVIYFLQLHITPNYGYSGLLYTIAGLFALSLIFLFSMPKSDDRSHASEHNSKRKKVAARFSMPSIIALVGIGIYFIGQTGIWGFLERIAVSKNMDYEFIGIVLGAVLVLCSIGAFLAIKVGTRFGILMPMIFGIGLFFISVALWLVSDNKWMYALSALIYASAWNFCLPYQLLAVNKTDKDGRYAAMIPAFQSIGGAVGPAMAGILIFDGNFIYVYLMAIITALASLVIFWLVTNRHAADNEQDIKTTTDQTTTLKESQLSSSTNA